MTIANWVANRLRDAEDVTGVDVLAADVVQVSRSEHPPFIAGIVSEMRVESEKIHPLVRGRHAVEIIANVPKGAFWTGGALALAHQHHIATGAFGDLMRVLSLADVRRFVPSETAFIERGLHQHRRIAGFDRVHDRLYRIRLRDDDQSEVMAVMLNEYEMTADHVRFARDRYGPFSIVVKTNPNGQPTRAAITAADQLSAEILTWGEFLAYLNSL